VAPALAGEVRQCGVARGDAGTKQATPLVYAYFVALITLNLAPTNVLSAPLMFVAKDHLHLTALQAATFKAFVTIPTFLAFGFGILRDRLNPFGMGDRGFILAGGAVVGLAYLIISGAPLTVAGLGAGLLIVSASLELIRAAYQAMMRNVAEMRLMSGRMSTTYQFLHNGVPMLGLFAGGWISDNVAWRNLLVAAGLVYLAFALFGLWRPAEVFDGLPTSGHASFAKLGADLKLLFRHRAVWLAALIWGVWAFSPGANTPLQYYWVDTLKLSKTSYGIYGGLFTGLSVPTILLFGLLCKRFSLWRLTWIATLVGIPQMLPLMFIHTEVQGYVAGSAMALAGGLGNAAFWGIVLRACPKELAGTGMLLAISLGYTGYQGSDVLGGWLYGRWGFAGCAWTTTAVYLLLIPLVFALPRALMAPADNQPVAA